MSRLSDITEQIKTLKNAQEFLKLKYAASDFHKQKEIHPHSPTQPRPQDEDVLKLLTAIQQLEKYIKELQDEQFLLLKAEES